MSHDDEDELAQRRRRREEERIRQDRMLTLTRHTGTRRLVRIRTHVPAESYAGYLLALSPALALVHAFDGFQPDGYTVTDVGQIANLMCGPEEQVWERIIVGEALLDGLEFAPLDLTNMASAITSILPRHRDLVVETDDDDGESTFHLGRVLAVEEKELLMRDLSRLGGWDATATRIPLDRIARFQFAKPNLRLLMKYAPDEPSGT
jgi:hypothetical protein